MAKKRLTGYTFDASAQTIVHADFSDITLEGIQLIINVTDQIIIYNFADTTKGGTLSTDTLTLEYNTTAMDDTDKLMILVEDGTTTQAVTGTFWQATQPISGTVIATATDLDIRNLVAATDIVDIGGNALTSLQLIDNAISGAGFNITQLAGVAVPIGAGLEATALRVTLATDSTGVISVDDNGGVLTVDGTVAVTNAGITTIAGAVAGTEMQVDVLTMPTVTVNAHAVTNAGTFVTQVNGDALTALQLIDNLAVAVDGNYLNVNMNIAGADISATVPMPVRPNEYDLATASTTHVKKYYTNAGAVTDGIIWSPAAGKRWFVTDIYIQVSAAATVTLEDDLAGGDSPIWKAELAANSGWSHSFTTPWFSGEDAADLIITTSAGNCYVTCVGYEI